MQPAIFVPLTVNSSDHDPSFPLSVRFRREPWGHRVTMSGCDEGKKCTVAEKGESFQASGEICALWEN